MSWIVEETDFISVSEIEKVKIYAYYQTCYDREFSFTVIEVCKYFELLGVHKPNMSRLKKNIIKSKSFVTKSNSRFALHITEFKALDESYNCLSKNNEKIQTTDMVIPETLYMDLRSYIVKLCEQINCSYENNIFDGCAVLMRRLLEILLIHSYENLNIDCEIRDNNGNYNMLSVIVEKAKRSQVLSLSRDTKECINDFRTLGNFSAHKIYYNAQKRDIDNILVKYRATIEELFYKSGLIE